MAATTTKSIYELRAEMKPDIGPDGKKDWSRYNATIVGATWDEKAPIRIPYLPGLDATQHPSARPRPYAPVSFAAPHGVDSGWTTVYRNKKQRRRMARGAYLTDDN